MRSRYNVGGSSDYSPVFRKKLFQEWLDNQKTDYHSQAELARMHGISPQVWIQVRRSKWFTEMKNAVNG